MNALHLASSPQIQVTYCTAVPGVSATLHGGWANASGANGSDTHSAYPVFGSSWACASATEMWLFYNNVSCKCFDYWDTLDQTTMNSPPPPWYFTSSRFIYSHSI